MNLDLLVKMTNEIAAFFDGEETDPAEARAKVAAHLRRFWAPQMRSQIVAHLRERGGGGLGDTARGAVELLGADAAP